MTAENERLLKEVERLGINEMDCKTLRAENERLQEMVRQSHKGCAGIIEENEKLQAENERLRVALKEIDEANEVSDEIAISLIARAALQSEDAPGRELTADEQKGMEEALRGSGTYNERWKSKP
jgi:predicted nuclease with TOPRIM domain